jgi:23S rRNA-/tRNA-specific pseudouridylate synthase
MRPDCSSSPSATPAYQALKTAFFSIMRWSVCITPSSAGSFVRQVAASNQVVERTDGSVHSTKQYGKGEQAVTLYETLRAEGGMSLVRVTLETGRKHQIRVHLAESSCPIIGDPVYGSQDTPREQRLMLVATRLGHEPPADGEAGGARAANAERV